jgi:hypothetical protein
LPAASAPGGGGRQQAQRRRYGAHGAEAPQQDPFDTDKDAAAASRRKVFDTVATDRPLVTRMHLHFPGFAHLVRNGTGYRLIPAAWEQAR